MATKKKEQPYESKAIITRISATSRASMKIKKTESFYTVEYSEERIIPSDLKDVDIKKEKELLWEAVNAECDAQSQEILETFG